MIAFKNQNKDCVSLDDFLSLCGSLEIRRYGLGITCGIKLCEKASRKVWIDAFVRVTSAGTNGLSLFKHDIDAWKFNEQPTRV
jgi:hypothetical protein